MDEHGFVVEDYWYEVSDEQILEQLSKTLEARLEWLDSARRFSLIARGAEWTRYRDGKPLPQPQDI